MPSNFFFVAVWNHFYSHITATCCRHAQTNYMQQCIQLLSYVSGLSLNQHYHHCQAFHFTPACPTLCLNTIYCIKCYKINIFWQYDHQPPCWVQNAYGAEAAIFLIENYSIWTYSFFFYWPQNMVLDANGADAGML